MSIGKPSDKLMEIIRGRIGFTSKRVAVSPHRGVDVGVVKLNNEVLICSTDPISLIPQMGALKSAQLSVNGVASDVATSGVMPQFAIFDLNLPPKMSDSLLVSYWKGIDKSCREYHVSIVAGHTGKFPGCDYTVVGGATMIAIGYRNDYVTSGMAQERDMLVATKSVAIEAVTVLAHSFPKMIEKRLGNATLRKARSLLDKTSIVHEAKIAASIGLRERGVTAMHDVTEGGLSSAILDIAETSHLSASVEEEQMPLFDEIREVCTLFGMDPYSSLGQGCLLISVRPSACERLLHALKTNHIHASVIGELSSKLRNQIRKKDGSIAILKRPKTDPYWQVYWTGTRRKWN